MTTRASGRGEAGIYLAFIATALALVWVASHLGAGGPATAAATPAPTVAAPVWHVLAVIAGISLLCAFGGWAARRLRQPAVVGEIATAVLLGPSALGALAPGLVDTLLPRPVLGQIGTLANVGVALFAFALGVHLDLGRVRERTRAAVWVSHASIAVPFVSGCFLALALTGTLGPRGDFAPFCLFLGAAMSITAFPVLGRILVDKGLLDSPIGQLAVVSAAVDDLTAWVGLSLVVAITRNHGLAPTVRVMALGLALAVVLLGGLRALLRRPAAYRMLSSAGITIGIALLAAAASDWIGLHMIFGAFVAGCAMPRSGAVRATVERARPLVDNVLLPLFFVLAGLKVDLRRLAEHPGELRTGVVILAIAIVGKLGAASVAARLSGFSARDSLAVGALMNTRGLTELVVLNIGLELGVLSQPLYTLLVLMALVTTAMTAPLLDLLRVTSRTRPGHLTSLRRDPVDA